MPRTFVTGDTHGGHDLQRLKDWELGKTLTKKDILIINGDWGGMFHPVDSLYINNEYEIHKFYKNAPWTTVVVLGNHENYDRIFKLKQVEMFGGMVYKTPSGVFILERGAIYNINGHTIWTMGGGLSIDKAFRTIGISWWPEEHPSKEELERGIEVLNEVNGKVDYVLTHTAPLSVVLKVFGRHFNHNPKFKDPLSVYLDEIKNVYLIDYKHWYCGHFHEDFFEADDKFTLLYYKIEELK